MNRTTSGNLRPPSPCIPASMFSTSGSQTPVATRHHAPAGAQLERRGNPAPFAGPHPLRALGRTWPRRRQGGSLLRSLSKTSLSRKRTGPGPRPGFSPIAFPSWGCLRFLRFSRFLRLFIFSRGFLTTKNPLPKPQKPHPAVPSLAGGKRSRRPPPAACLPHSPLRVRGALLLLSLPKDPRPAPQVFLRTQITIPVLGTVDKRLPGS